MVQYGTTVQYIQSTVQHFQATEFQRGGRGARWDLGQSIYRAIRAQARNIVPPRLQQINPVQTRGFSLVG